MSRKPDAPLPGDCPGAIDGIRAGIGGWTYAPWRGDMFYPQGLPQRRELEYAARHVSSIEINGTYYRAQTAATYAKWAAEVPPGFVFSLKAPMRITQARKLVQALPQAQDFLEGITALGDALGPVLWQFDAGTRPDLQELREFAQALPKQLDGRELRHVLDVRDATLVSAELVALARDTGVALVFTDSTQYPSYADVGGGGFVYARLMMSQAQIATGYAPDVIHAWAKRARTWAQGDAPADLPYLTDIDASRSQAPRDVYVYFIASAKERNPAAAMAFIGSL